MKISAKTDTGRVRDMNQDSFEYSMPADDVCIAVVCDGMGGHAAGNVASLTAVNSISERLNAAYSDSYDFESFGDILVDAIVAANKAVFQKSLEDSSLAGMGTTVVAAVIDKDAAYIAHVGDSRIYIGEQQGLRQLTHDHSYVQTLVDSGYITEEEALTHPQRNMITRALGIEGDIKVDFARIPLAKGDVLLLCTDGLTNYVDKDLIYNELLDEDFESCAERLVGAANQSGGGDNITVLAILIDKDAL